MCLCVLNVNSIGDYCCKPDHKVLSNIRKEFSHKWKHVGYSLGLEHPVIENIDLNEKCVEEQAFRMLCNWIQHDTDPCYCKLISAMEWENLNSGVNCLKECIKQGSYSF